MDLVRPEVSVRYPQVRQARLKLETVRCHWAQDRLHPHQFIPCPNKCRSASHNCGCLLRGPSKLCRGRHSNLPPAHVAEWVQANQLRVQGLVQVHQYESTLTLRVPRLVGLRGNP